MKVAILGAAPGRDYAPYDDPSFEIWALNDMYLSLDDHQLRRVTRWFELHGDTPLTRARRPANHLAQLESLRIPVYTFFKLPGVSLKRTFPLADAVAAGREYFACTCAYQIALALSEGATDIGLYGGPFVGSREALVEAKCVEWWLGYAEGKGVRVTVKHESLNGLMQQPYRYALDDFDERLLALEIVRDHHARGVYWLIDETKRLGLQAPTSVDESTLIAG